MVARLGRRPHLGALALVVLAVLLGWGYLTCVATIAYSYAWWGMGPSMQWATPNGAATGLPAAAAMATPRAEADLPVPKLLHQTWKTHDVPEVWKAAQKSCIDLHPDYEYKLWTDGDAVKLIEEHYPWFLPTFLAYPYSIQRVDAIRYFLLYHHGGIYIDLDMGCRTRLDFLREHNFTAPLTYPVGISNDILAARPGDLYLERAIHQLRRWNKWMVIKYVQVMFSTGPMFLTVQMALFPKQSDIAVVPRDVYGKYDTSGDAALYHLHGSSWHAEDAAFVFWLDRHRTALVAIAALAALAVLAVLGARCVARVQAARSSTSRWKE